MSVTAIVTSIPADRPVAITVVTRSSVLALCIALTLAHTGAGHRRHSAALTHATLCHATLSRLTWIGRSVRHRWLPTLRVRIGRLARLAIAATVHPAVVVRGRGFNDRGNAREFVAMSYTHLPLQFLHRILSGEVIAKWNDDQVGLGAR